MRRAYVTALLLFGLSVAAQDRPPALPEGTTLAVQLSQQVDASKVRAGDIVRAKLLAPVLQGGKVAVPKDAEIIGRVVDSSPLVPISGSRLVLRFEEAHWRKGSMSLHAYIVRQLAWKSTVYAAADRSMCPPIYRFTGGQSSSTSTTSGQQTSPPQNTQPAPPPAPVPLGPPPRPAESPLDRCDPYSGDRRSRAGRPGQEKVTFISPPLEGIEIRRLAATPGATELVSSTKVVVLKKGTMFELANLRPEAGRPAM